MNPSHVSTRTGREAVVGLVEVEELTLLLHEREVAFERVAPPVVLALELPAGAVHLFVGVVLPHQLVPAVAADVVERTHLVVAGAHHDDRGAGRVDLLGEVAPLLRDLLHPTDVEPRPGEDRLALELVVLG